MLVTAVIKKTPNGDEIIGIDRPIPPLQDTPIPFLIEETPSPGYADISSVENWEKFGNRPELNRDYTYVRSEIKEIIKQKGINTTLSVVNDPDTISKVEGDRYLVGENPVGDFADREGFVATVQSDLSWEFEDTEAVGYRELSLAEKEIAARYNIGDLNDHEQDFFPAKVFAWNTEYHAASTATRKKRRLHAETIVYRDLPLYGEIIVAEMRFSPYGDLISRYTEHGKKGTLEDRSAFSPNPTPGICDYLFSRSIFAPDGSNPGLSSKAWTTRTGRPLSELVQQMYDVLVYGIYD